MNGDPANEVLDCLLAALKAQAGALGVDPGQIRRRLDTDGDPKGLSGVTVAVEDRGDHPGCTGRVLVDVGVEVTVWSHLNDDSTGEQCEATGEKVLQLLPSLSYSLSSWRVAYGGGWKRTAPAMAGVFRKMVLTAVLPLM